MPRSSPAAPATDVEAALSEALAVSGEVRILTDVLPPPVDPSVVDEELEALRAANPDRRYWRVNATQIASESTIPPEN